MTSGRGWLLETVEDGFLLKRENAITKEDCGVCQEKSWRCDGIDLFTPVMRLLEVEEKCRL